MKKIVLSSFLIVFVCIVFAQERFVLNSSGGQNSSMMWSVGESLSFVIQNSSGENWNSILYQSGSSLETAIPYVVNRSAEIYPNPANNEVWFKCNNSKNLIGELKVYSSTGSIVLCRKNFNAENALDISTLRSGYYVIKLSKQLNNEESIFKLVKK